MKQTGLFSVLFQVTYKECQAEHEILLERNEVCRKYKDSDHPHNADLFPCLISSHNYDGRRRLTGTGQVTDC